ncbi:hypothetical protein MC885_001090, partial [Smutsia gigantea]
LAQAQGLVNLRTALGASSGSRELHGDGTSVSRALGAWLPRASPRGDPVWPGWEGASLTQVRHAAEAWVEADLSHLVGARQEEVDHAVSDYAAGEADELVVEAAPLPEAVPAAWRAGLHAQQLPDPESPYASSSSLLPRLAPGGRASPGGLNLLEALFPPQPRGLSPTRSSGVRSSTSTSLSSRVRAVKTKSSSTHSTYLVVTWDMARFRPANQPWE